MTRGARVRRPVTRTGGADTPADDHLIEDQLARLASQAQWADLPGPVREYAQALTMDALANAITRAVTG